MLRRRVAHCSISWCWIEDMVVSPVAPVLSSGSGSACTVLSVGSRGAGWGKVLLSEVTVSEKHQTEL